MSICGRKILLLDLRKSLLAKHEKYMRISMPQAHVGTGANETYTRHLALWHDHSTILYTGCILFAMWILYDSKVFMMESEYYTLSRQQISNLQEVIEEPVIYMIAPSSSLPELQIALVPD